MQRQHHVVARRLGIGPGLGDAHRMAAGQQFLPAPGGAPVAVVGVGEGGAYDHHRWGIDISGL
jgi:hypothetical protein